MQCLFSWCLAWCRADDGLAADDAFDDAYEWDGEFDPELDTDVDDLYGVGDGLLEDDDNGYHAYHIEDYAVDDDGGLDSDEEDDDDANGDEYNVDDDDGALVDLEDGYIGYDGSIATPLFSRVTVLGASKSDVASMIWRVVDGTVEDASAAAADDSVQCEADNCIVRRMLYAARMDSFRIVRVKTSSSAASASGLLVDADVITLGADNDEAYPCSCSQGGIGFTEPHCNMPLPLTAVDDDVDEDRVNCVLTSLLSSTAQAALDNLKVKEEGVSNDIDIADVVSVSHAARFVRPSLGIEIVAKVFSAVTDDKAAAATPASTATVMAPEVFAFQWALSNRVRLLEEVPAQA